MDFLAQPVSPAHVRQQGFGLTAWVKRSTVAACRRSGTKEWAFAGNDSAWTGHARAMALCGRARARPFGLGGRACQRVPRGH